MKLLFTFAASTFIVANMFGQTNETSTDVPLNQAQFSAFVRRDFSSLNGNDDKTLKNAISTTFDKNESSLSGKFLLGTKKINKPNKFNKAILGSFKIGQASSVLDFADVKMPLLNFSLTYNHVFKPRLFYSNSERSTSDSEAIWTHKQYNWVSGGIEYNNNQYKIYDPSRSFDKQLFDTTYSSFVGNIGINFYRWWKQDYFLKRGIVRPSAFYFKLNYQFKRGNNIAKLKKADFIDEKYVVDSSTNTTRVISTKETAYRGQYKTSMTHKFSAEALIGINKYLFIDLFSDYAIAENSEDVLSYGGGLYFNAKNEKKEAIINFGLFIKVPDIGEKPFIGIKTSLPINL